MSARPRCTSKAANRFTSRAPRIAAVAGPNSSQNQGYTRILRGSMKQYNKAKNGQNFQIGNRAYYTPEGPNVPNISARPRNIGTVVGMNTNYIHFKPNYWNRRGGTRKARKHTR